MDFVTTIVQQPHTLLQPDSSLHASALTLAKHYLDPLASGITDAQDQRQKDARKSRKRKRSARNADESDDEREDLLRLRRIYMDGFDVSQVWQQARKVLDAAGDELDRDLPELLGQGQDTSSEDEDDQDDDLELGEEGVDWQYDGDDINDEEDSSANVDPEQEQGSSAEEGSLNLADETPPSDLSEDEEDENVEEYVKDPNGLNDGFFSIDHFNKQTQFLEQQDARGDPDDGAASDEEEIDWTADPLTQGFAQAASSKRAQRKATTRDDDDLAQNEDEEGSDEEEGPTFGNANLNGPESDEEMEDEVDQDAGIAGMGGDFSNTNDILYSDFFAPPAKNVPKSKKQGKRSGRFQQRGDDFQRSLAEKQEHDNEQEVEEMERAMSGVQRDLFDDEPSEEEDAAAEDELGELPPGQRNLSSHERAQLALRAEIRRLEAENVADKHWALTGETVAPARPQNALLEEDLEFERAGKPVPVITAEINESIEDLIKRRILAKEFDEVRRRRPDEVLNGSGKDPRRGKLEELSDSKPKQGLAEEYEQDFLKQNDPNYVDTRSEALKAQHHQIEQQWAQVSGQLDALSNWHYKPRPVAPSLNVRVDAPTITMEDARPSAGGEVAGASALAPQELYSVGADGKRMGEIVSKGGTIAGKEEESQDQRTRRRRRQKERRRKLEGSKLIAPEAGADVDGKGLATGSQKRAGRAEVVNQLKKGGVKVIGRKGELQDVEGNAVKKDAGRLGAGNFKL